MERRAPHRCVNSARGPLHPRRGGGAGIYVVAWPDLGSWTDGTDRRRTTLASLDRAAIEAELARQASDLDQRGSTVHVVHLDIAYRRPTAEPQALQSDT